MKNDELQNTYLNNMVGVITRTYYNLEDAKRLPEKHSFLDIIYQNHWHYFDDSELRREGDECWPLEADTMIGV